MEKKKRQSKVFQAVLYIVVIILISGGFIQLDDSIINVLRDKIYDSKLEKVTKVDLSNDGFLGNTIGNINNGGDAVENEDYIYYLKDHIWLCRSDKDFNNEETVTKKDTGHGIWHLNIVGDYLIYMQDDQLIRSKLDENDISKVPLKKYMIDLHIIDNWVYFIKVSNSEHGIYKMTINGEYLEQLSNSNSMDMAIYNGKIYYSYEYDDFDHLNTMDLDGSNKQTIKNIKTRNMVVDDNVIYYMDAKDYKLYRLNQDKSIELLVDEKISTFCITDNWIYYSKFGNTEFDTSEGLYKVDTNGQQMTLVSSDNQIEQLSVIGEWVLYRSSEDREYPSLKRVNIKSDEIIKMD